MHGLKGFHRTPNMVCMRESQDQSSPLCWVQNSSSTLGRARHYTEVIFDGNKHQKSSNGKKNRLFKHLLVLLVVLLCFQMCQQQTLLSPNCCSTSCWSPPWVSVPSWKSAKESQPKIWGRGREFRKANFHTGTEKEVLPKDFVLLGKACGGCRKGISVEKGQAALGRTNTLN